jgi:hypothetical protein
MPDPPVNQALDQACALLADVYPPFLHRFFRNSIEAGFSEDQAMYLTAVLLESVAPSPSPKS